MPNLKLPGYCLLYNCKTLFAIICSSFYLVLGDFEVTAQLAGAVEYTDHISAVRDKTPLPYECPVYDTEQSGGEASVMLELWVMYSFIAIAPRSTLALSGST